MPVPAPKLSRDLSRGPASLEAPEAARRALPAEPPAPPRSSAGSERCAQAWGPRRLVLSGTRTHRPDQPFGASGRSPLLVSAFPTLDPAVNFVKLRLCVSLPIKNPVGAPYVSGKSRVFHWCGFSPVLPSYRFFYWECSFPPPPHPRPVQLSKSDHFKNCFLPEAFPGPPARVRIYF